MHQLSADCCPWLSRSCDVFSLKLFRKLHSLTNYKARDIKMGKTIRISVFALFVLSVFGCSSQNAVIHPDFIDIGDTGLKPISHPHPVALINAADGSLIKVTGEGVSYDTNLKEWADQAILIIKHWLTNNDVPIVEDAERKLFVSIFVPEVLPSRRLTRIYLQLSVTTGTNVVKIYPAEATANGLDRAAGYAISYSVERLVKDDAISQYISN
jgi:hypothetical protein